MQWGEGLGTRLGIGTQIHYPMRIQVVFGGEERDKEGTGLPHLLPCPPSLTIGDTE